MWLTMVLVFNWGKRRRRPSRHWPDHGEWTIRCTDRSGTTSFTARVAAADDGRMVLALPSGAMESGEAFFDHDAQVELIRAATTIAGATPAGQPDE
jgi:hypothetical protein